MSRPTTPPPSSSRARAIDPETPLHLSISQLALSLSQNPRTNLLGDNLLQEGMLDDEEGSFEVEESHHHFEGAGRDGEGMEEEGRAAEEKVGAGKEFVYTGSMGILPPSTPNPKSNTTPHSDAPSPTTADETPIDPSTAYSLYDTALLAQEAELSHEDRARAKELREERDLMRVLNSYLRGANEGLERATQKIDAVEETLETTHALLDLYVRLSSQTEHTQQLILDGQWGGVTKDIEALQQQEAIEAYEAELRAVEAREVEAKAAESRALAAASLAERERKKSLSKSEGSSSVRRGAPTTRSRGLSSSVRGTSIPSRSTSSIPTTSSTTTATTGPALRGSTNVPGVRGVRGLRSRVLTRGGTGSGRGRGNVDSSL